MTDETKPRKFSLAQIEEGILNDLGFCLSCGEQTEDRVEPDAQKYRCDSCGAMQVYGAETLVLMGRVDTSKA